MPFRLSMWIASGFYQETEIPDLVLANLLPLFVRSGGKK
jgi:hypothetical protein